MDGTLGQIERELVDGCLKGRRESQQQLYKRYASKMFGVCLGYAKDRDDAKDILQEGFIKVFSKLHLYNGEGSLEGWVRRIIVNCALDQYRKSLKDRALVKIDETHDIPPVEVSVLERMQATELLELVNKLPDGARIIFNLYVVEGYTHKEIAEMLNINTGTSKSQFARARALLQDLVAKMYKEPARKQVSAVE
jgi:RNA polymerase sigma factor (sigma-70 family)